MECFQYAIIVGRYTANSILAVATGVDEVYKTVKEHCRKLDGLEPGCPDSNSQWAKIEQ